MARLYHLPYSPWSEKARWALDHRHVPYEAVEHLPLLGDLRLRILLRKPTGRVTVPLLEDGGVWYEGSLEIARHADAVGSGPRLFPAGREVEVEAWSRLSEEALTAARGVMVLRQAEDPRLALEALPPGVPASVKPLLAPAARLGMQAFIAKYRMRDAAASHPRVLARALEDLARALEGGRRYLVGDAFTYADIAMAVTLQMVSPVDERYMALGPGGREGWTSPELAARFAGLLRWRDGLYAEHR